MWPRVTRRMIQISITAYSCHSRSPSTVLIGSPRKCIISIYRMSWVLPTKGSHMEVVTWNLVLVFELCRRKRSTNSDAHVILCVHNTSWLFINTCGEWDKTQNMLRRRYVVASVVKARANGERPSSHRTPHANFETSSTPTKPHHHTNLPTLLHPILSS